MSCNKTKLTPKPSMMGKSAYPTKRAKVGRPASAVSYGMQYGTPRVKLSFGKRGG